MIDDRLIVFGAGAEGIKTIYRIGEQRILYLADNNVDLHGCYLCSKKILSLEETKELVDSDGFRVIISSRKFYSEILEQLTAVGIKNVISTSRFLIEEAFGDNERGHRIILMNTHAGINIGDQLISEAELKFFQVFLPGYSVVEIPADLIQEELLFIKGKVFDDDIIAISGGGYMGSLWLDYGEDNVRKIIGNFKNNRVIVMPQSIYFEDSMAGKNEYIISKKTYNCHSNLIICAREKRTYGIVKQMLESESNVRLMPDMALLLKGNKNISIREKAGICFRSDKEKVIPDASAEIIKSHISSEIVFLDMLADRYIGITDRKRIIELMISKVSSLKYVITDRLHCMILCAITGTPCVAFDNLTGKVSGVYEWLKDNTYIHVINDIELATTLIEYYENISISYKYDMRFVLQKYAELSECFENEE